MPTVSTIAPAINALKAHFDNVASANTALAVGVYVGMPTKAVANNYLQIGQYETGSLFTTYLQDFADLPGMGMGGGAGHKDESYDIVCTLRVWDGNVDPLGRIADAMTLLDGVMTEMQGDIGGSGSLTASGSWQVRQVENPVSGPLGEPGRGWGLVISFNIEVRNVRLAA